MDIDAEYSNEIANLSIFYPDIMRLSLTQTAHRAIFLNGYNYFWTK